MIRKNVHYSGRVQGVGFRWTTRRVASGHEVTGYVKNLPDGRVQVVAEGEKDEVNAFLADLEKAMAGHIRDRKVDESPACSEFDAFEIRH